MASKSALGQVKIEVQWPGGQVKLDSVSSLVGLIEKLCKLDKMICVLPIRSYLKA